VICLDEIGFSTALDRLYGYAPKGQRLVDFVPYGHWKTTTFLGGLTTREIARELGIKTKTVEFHRATIKQKLGVKGLAGIVKYAIRTGLVQP